MVGSASDQQQQQYAYPDGRQADQAQLRILQLQRLLEDTSPGLWVDEGQQPFNDQHQPSRTQQQIPTAHLLPGVRMALKKSLLWSITITSPLLRKLAR